MVRRHGSKHRDGRRRKLVVHINPQAGSKESKLECQCLNFQTLTQWHISFNKLVSPKPPQNSATNWRSGVQVSESLGDMFFKSLYPQSQQVSEPHKPPTFRILSMRALAPCWILSSQVTSTEWSFSGRIFPDHLMRTEAGKWGSQLHWL